jgi:hypothetical protein
MDADRVHNFFTNHDATLLYLFLFLKYLHQYLCVWRDRIKFGKKILDGRKKSKWSFSNLIWLTFDYNVPTDGNVSSSMESPSLLLTSPLTSRLDDSGEPSLCIAVIGATGELARGKIFPALFALYYSGFLPEVQFNRFSWFFVYAFQRFTSYVET